MRPILGTVLVAVAGLVLACTDARLQPAPGDDLERFDNLLRIEGELCTEPADRVTFPVKILFLLDQSASLQCTDPANQRFAALDRVIGDLLPLPNVQFGFVGFSSWSRRQTFTRNADDIRRFMDPAGGLGPATDYQGALASAIQMVEQDMVEAGAAVRARTKYVVVLVSDGSPEPRCNAGCEDTRSSCSDGRDNDGDGRLDGADPDCVGVDNNATHPDNLYAVCNTDSDFRETRAPGSYVDMQGVCPAYNQAEQLLARIADLRSLEDAYSAGSVSFHTVLLFAEQAAVEAVCPDAAAQFGYDHDIAMSLLQALARTGGGTFRDVNLQRDDDNFLEFDFTSLESPYWLTDLVAYDAHAHPTLDGPIPDRDMDGLADDAEAEQGSDAGARDSDGDLYSDLFETRFRGAGFDPVNPDAPALSCNDPVDLDGDGLNDCEERFLGSDPRLPDTDGDRLPDGLELRMGTDPLTHDALEDPDFDGLLNRDEIRAGTLPHVPDVDRWRHAAVRYGLDDLGDFLLPDPDTGDETTRRCYGFTVSRLPLVATPLTVDRGLNRILLHAMEEPVQLPGSQALARMACVEVFYQGESFKDPPSGVVDLGQAWWDDLRDTFSLRFDWLGLACGETEPLNRGRLEAVMNECLPRRVQVGRYLRDRDELRDLVRRYFDGGLGLRVPERASDVFVRMELFDPDLHCQRPWEIARLQQLIDTIGDACAACDREAAP